MQSAGLTQYVPLKTVPSGHLHPGLQPSEGEGVHVLFICWQVSSQLDLHGVYTLFCGHKGIVGETVVFGSFTVVSAVVAPGDDIVVVVISDDLKVVSPGSVEVVVVVVSGGLDDALDVSDDFEVAVVVVVSGD